MWVAGGAGAASAGLLYVGWRSRQSPPQLVPCADVKVRWGSAGEREPGSGLGRIHQLHRRQVAMELIVELTSDEESRGRVRKATAVKINVYGPSIPSVARMMLPLAQGKYMDINRDHDTVPTVTLRFGSGASPKRTTVLKQLAKLEAADSLFILEVLHQGSGLNDESLCVVPLRPSVLRAELERQQPIEGYLDPASLPSVAAAKRQTGDTSAGDFDSDPGVAAALRYRARERTMGEAVVRFAFCPLVALATIWALLLRPAATLATLPRLPGFQWAAAAPRLEDVLPLMPGSLLDAYEFGVLCERLQSPTGPRALRWTAGRGRRAEALRIAEELAGRPVTADEICGLKADLLLVRKHRSMWQRVRGFFSFVNALWLGAIFGITISIGPVIWQITKPLRKLFKKLAVKVKAALIWFAEKILVPLVSRLHEWGVWEALAHFVSLALIAQGVRLPPEPGLMVCVSGLVVSGLSMAYSYKLHASRLNSRKTQKALSDCLYLVFGILAMPLAVLFKSTLLGYLTVACLLSFLGFSGAAFPLCYVIGWNDEDSMVRTAIAGALAVAAFGAARAADMDDGVLAPFVSAVSVLGGLTHYLALLCMSSRHYDGESKEYMAYNLGMLVSLVVWQGFSRIFGIAGLANTSTVFFVLWCLEKSEELHNHLDLNGWFLVLFGSIFTYFAALWLHANPEFVLSVFRSME